MPGQKSQIHLEMLEKEKGEHLYGLQWGDPDESASLAIINTFPPHLNFLL